MSFFLLKGTFHVKGYSPDGDSVKFRPDNLNLLLEKIDGTVKYNKTNDIQLRVEAIDALETHFLPKAKGSHKVHQPIDSALSACDFLLKLLGITGVKWNSSNSIVAEAKDGTPGYIISRAVDNNKYGRPVSFWCRGKAEEKDGSEIYLDKKRIKESVNYKMLKYGFAYPTYYKTLFFDLRNEFTKVVVEARTQKKGIWKTDKSKSFSYASLDSITNDNIIFPKLFRRIVEHIEGGGTIGTLKDFLKAKKDGLWILPEAHYTNAMDYIVDVKGDKVGLNVLPENIIFEPQMK